MPRENEGDKSLRGERGTEKKFPPPPTPVSRQEQEIAPGVYFSANPSLKSRGAAELNDPNVSSGQEVSISELRRERDELKHSLTYLISSNHQMMVMDPKQEDRDIVQAIAENIKIIEKRQRRVEEIERKIGGMNNCCDSNQSRSSATVSEHSLGTQQDPNGGLFL